MKNPTHLLTALLLLCFSSWSMAQWQWLDKDGRKVFSDRAPPPDIAEKNILKRPGKAPEPAPAKDDADAADASPKVESASPVVPSKADKELEAKKKQIAQAEAAKRKAEQERRQIERADNCARARQAKVTFDSGIPIERTNAAGQREVLNPAMRASELQRLNLIIERDCKPLATPPQ